MKFFSKNNVMKTKTLTNLLWLSSLLIVIITAAAFLLKFWENKISDDPAVWGQFGDYFGGILNPMLSLINLIILTYLSIRLVNDEDERNKWTLQELTRPYGEIFYNHSKSSIKITIQNCGLGPLIMNDILITDGKQIKAKNFIEFIAGPPPNVGFEYEIYNLTEAHGTVGKEKEIILLMVSIEKDDSDSEKFLRDLEKKLSGLEIQIRYSDMYKREIDILKSLIDFDNPVI